MANPFGWWGVGGGDANGSGITFFFAKIADSKKNWALGQHVKWGNRDTPPCVQKEGPTPKSPVMLINLPEMLETNVHPPKNFNNPSKFKQPLGPKRLTPKFKPPPREKWKFRI